MTIFVKKSARCTLFYYIIIIFCLLVGGGHMKALLLLTNGQRKKYLKFGKGTLTKGDLTDSTAEHVSKLNGRWNQSE
jgi:hypothetical protein